MARSNVKKVAAASDQTQLPFAEAFTQLRAASGITFREIAESIERIDGRTVSLSHLADIANGAGRPSMDTIARIAVVFDKAPSYFAEYRLAQGRALLDQDGPQGLDNALAAFDTLPYKLREMARDVDPLSSPNAAPRSRIDRRRNPSAA